MSQPPQTALQLALEAARSGPVTRAMETLQNPATAQALEAARKIATSAPAREALRQIQSSPIAEALETIRASHALVSSDPLGPLRDPTAALGGPVTAQQLKKRAHIEETAREAPPLSLRRPRFVQGSYANETLVRASADLDVVTGVEDIGALVQRARRAQKMSQQNLADRAGVGRRFVSELENGKPTLEFARVLQVARAAGVDLFTKASA